MLQIEKLTEKDKGRWVWYVPAVGPLEKGRIKSWSPINVFVVYKCNGEWGRFQDFTAAATSPEDLRFIEHAPHCRAAEDFMCACLPPDIDQLESSFL